MNVTLTGGTRSGTVRICASKSQAHRLLICAALGKSPVLIRCASLSNDIRATCDCLRALGARIEEREGAFFVRPIAAVPQGLCELPCGESGTTLRFLLSLVGALGARAVFRREGRLPERPLAPLDALLCAHGMTVRSEGAELYCEGLLRGGAFEIPGNVSSQFISSLMLSLPLLEEDSVLRVTGAAESAPYIAMTEQAVSLAGIREQWDGGTVRIPGRQRFALPETAEVEGDWSNAAFFLCMGALSERGVRVEGLRTDSAQGDRAVLEILRRFGAEITESAGAVTVRRGALRGCEIDARAVPDLIPTLAAVASVAAGETRIVHAARLRLKESDRLRTTAQLLTALGGEVRELPDGLTVTGVPSLAGGTADSARDHRIAMAAAVAACASRDAVTVLGAECADKSYPAFWAELAKLEEEGPWRSM